MTFTINYIKTYAFCLVICSISGCKKFVSIDPPVTQVTNAAIFASDNLALAAVTGIYSQMMNDPSQFCDGMTTIYAGLASDELKNYFPGTDDEFVLNEITQVNHGLLSGEFWKPAYNYIYAANACIEGAVKSTALSAGAKDEVIGEAEFVRAFCYFELVNLFGKVPLILNTDYSQTSFQPRAEEDAIYVQMIRDLSDATSRLSTDYLSTASYTGERTRPNKYAAMALLARVYLYKKDWPNAIAMAGNVINSGLYSLEPDLNNVFMRSSTEAIWQLQPVNPNWNTWEGEIFIAPSADASPAYIITDQLLQSFESGDARASNWIGQRNYNGQLVYFPNKYKIYGDGAPQTEYYMVLRLAEQYLIRAEASTNMNDPTSAQADINVIRNRAGLPSVSITDNASLLLAVEKERRSELFVEWGHRWFDLKRTGRIDEILSASKPTWKSTAALWPVPTDQILINTSLTQNPGY